MTNNRHGDGRAVWLSAVDGRGCAAAAGGNSRESAAAQDDVAEQASACRPGQGRQRAKLFRPRCCHLTRMVHDDGGWTLDLNISGKRLAALPEA